MPTCCICGCAKAIRTSNVTCTEKNVRKKTKNATVLAFSSTMHKRKDSERHRGELFGASISPHRRYCHRTLTSIPNQIQSTSLSSQRKAYTSCVPHPQRFRTPRRAGYRTICLCCTQRSAMPARPRKYTETARHRVSRIRDSKALLAHNATAAKPCKHVPKHPPSVVRFVDR